MKNKNMDKVRLPWTSIYISPRYLPFLIAISAYIIAGFATLVDGWWPILIVVPASIWVGSVCELAQRMIEK